MTWKLDKSRPICPQIVEQLCVRIANGQLVPGEKLMSVREAAVEAGVNPNTVQKAFEQLEAKKLIYSVRGSGWYVSDTTDDAKEETERLLYAKARLFFDDRRALGFTDAQIKQYVEEWSE